VELWTPSNGIDDLLQPHFDNVAVNLEAKVLRASTARVGPDVHLTADPALAAVLFDKGTHWATSRMEWPATRWRRRGGRR
jgi:hypothetical protein